MKQIYAKWFVSHSQKYLLMTLMFLVMLSLIGEKQPVNAQQTILGPVVFGRPFGGDIITFQDIGLDRTWQINLPNSSFVPTVWSNDGCNLLMYGGGTWAIISLPSAAMYEIPPLSVPDVDKQFSGTMIWSYDAKALTWTVYFDDHDVRLYSVNLNSFAVTPLLSLQESGSAVRWLSDTELLYQTRSGYYIWDAKAIESHLYQTRLHMPPDWFSELYLTDVSPNQAYATRYYSQNALRSFIRASEEIQPSLDASPEYVATLEAMPKIPGFDIYSASDSKIKHVDVAGQFLQFLRWSPSGGQIVVTTDPRTTPSDTNGLFVYDLKADSVQRIGDFPAMYNAEYGGYEPAWSPDGEWLVFNTPTGYVIYNVVSQETSELSDEFDGFYMRVEWSPVMDYSNSTC